MAAIRYDIRPGQVIEMEGQIYRFSHYNRENEVVLTNQETLTERHIPADRFAKLVETEKVDFVGTAVLTNRDLGLPVEANLVHLQDPLVKAMFEYRRAYVSAWANAEDQRLTEPVLRELIAKVSREKGIEPVGRATLAKWIKLFRDSGFDYGAIVPAIKDRGNRRPRLTADVRELFGDALWRGYAHHTEPAMSEAYKLAEKAFVDHNQGLPPERQMKLPSKRAAHRYAERVWNKYALAVKRKGKAWADKRFRAKGSGPISTFHNEFWEIDHTEIDVMVLDDETRQLIGRPWLTVIIDRATRMIVGFHIGFDKPSIGVVLECLRMAIFPKTWVAEQFPNIKGDWPCFGLPICIVPDNGTEFRGDDFREAMNLLGVDVQFTPEAKPWYKGIVEAWFRRAKREVFIPALGSTSGDFYRRREKDVQPEFAATVTLGRLRELVVQWLVEDYSRTEHDGIDLTPREAWERSTEWRGVAPLPPRDTIDYALSITHRATPQDYGIRYEGLTYNSGAITEILALPGRPKRLPIKVDPRDLGSIKLFNPATKKFITLSVCGADRDKAEGVSLTQYKIARAMAENQPDRFLREGGGGIAQAIQVLREQSEHQLRTGKGNKKARTGAAAVLQSSGPRAFEKSPITDGRDISEVLGGAPIAIPMTEVVDPETGEITEVPMTQDAVAVEPVAQVAPAKPRKPKTRRKQQPAPTEEQAPPPVIFLPADEDDVDLDQIARSKGLGITFRDNKE